MDFQIRKFDIQKMSDNGVRIQKCKLANRVSFGQKEDGLSDSQDLPKINKNDELLEGGFLNKQKYKIEAANTIPVYIAKGLKGDPSSTFYEFMQLCKVPYFIGGPMLAAMFAAGISNFNYQDKACGKTVAKRIAAGVGFYYIGVALAKAAINIPVKLFRGVDLNMPYRKVVESKSPDSKVGYLKKTTEFHNVFESIDFTRWQLLQNHKDKSKSVNNWYDNVAKKYGYEEDLRDSDSALRPYISKTIIMSRAWKYALTIPFVALGIGLGNQEALDGVFRNFKNTFKQVFSRKELPQTNLPMPLKDRLIIVKNFIKNNSYKPLKKSFVQFWTGNSKYSSIFGKVTILASILAPIYGNYRILKVTSAKDERVVSPANENQSSEIKTNDK